MKFFFFLKTILLLNKKHFCSFLAQNKRIVTIIDLKDVFLCQLTYLFCLKFLKRLYLIFTLANLLIK